MGPKTDIKDKFHVGDRVIGCGTYDDQDLTDMIGTVVGSLDYGADIFWSVEFDEPKQYFHDCGGKAKQGHGWNCLASVLELYTEPENFEAPSLDGLFD